MADFNIPPSTEQKETYHYQKWCWGGTSPSKLLELITLNLEIHYKTPSTISPVWSRTDAGSGSGYIITTDNNYTTLEERSFKLPDYCSIYQTELTAIIEACTLYLSTYTKTCIIILWSDSLSSVQAISLLSTRNRTTGDFYDSLDLSTSQCTRIH